MLSVCFFENGSKFQSKRSGFSVGFYNFKRLYKSWHLNLLTMWDLEMSFAFNSEIESQIFLNENRIFHLSQPSIGGVRLSSVVGLHILDRIAPTRRAR